MKSIKWSYKKNSELKRDRGVTFEELLASRFMGIEKHPTRENQKLMLFEYNNYVWIVPYVRGKSCLFLKTAYPNRKYTQKYLRGEPNEEN